MKRVVCLLLFVSLKTYAQQGNEQRTVSECASDLRIKVWWDSEKYNAEKYCEEYSQVTIDCAINLMKAKTLTYRDFKKAVRDCHRTRK